MILGIKIDGSLRPTVGDECASCGKTRALLPDGQSLVPCDHCEAWWCRIGCFSFHRPVGTVPYVNRQAERVDRRRIARIEAGEAA